MAMRSLAKQVFYGTLAGAQVPRLLRRRTRGAVFMLHRLVRQQCEAEFSPNRQFALTPDQLTAILDCLAAWDYDVVDLDEAIERMGTPNARRFACLTFDDGYRDNLEIAYPVLAARGLPMTTYVTTGFIDRTDPAWWFGLEDCIQQGRGLHLPTRTAPPALPTGSTAEKHRAFDIAARWLQRASREERREAAAAMCERYDVHSEAQTDELFMTWDELVRFHRLPGVTLGAHTVSHPALNALSPNELRAEIGASKKALDQRLDAPVHHFAYPYGDATTTGPREFAMAAECGFRTATTTRHDVLRHQGRTDRFDLPRLPTDPFESRRSVEVKLSGIPAALQNLRQRLHGSAAEQEQSAGR